jgi:hypothetical protein
MRAPVDSCSECERLRNHSRALLQQEMDLLREFHAAVRSGDLAAANLLNGPIEGARKFAQIGQEDLRDHEATHGDAKSSVA